jgi:hypothetical protein
MSAFRSLGLTTPEACEKETSMTQRMKLCGIIIICS